jgi:hypothetical protein
MSDKRPIVESFDLDLGRAGRHAELLEPKAPCGQSLEILHQ